MYKIALRLKDTYRKDDRQELLCLYNLIGKKNCGGPALWS